MKSELVAYLIRSDGIVCELPTEGLLAPLHQLTQQSATAGQGVPADSAAVYEFLHALKQMMQVSKSRCREMD